MTATKRKKQRDKYFKRIVWLASIGAVVWVAFQLRETPFTSSTTHINNAKSAEIVLAEGFEPFTVSTLGITFQYPEDQAPLKAAKTAASAEVVLATRDMQIEFYSGPGFAFQPWIDDGLSSGCFYDGALHNFQSNDELDCLFSGYTAADQQVLTHTFTRGETTKHVTILPVLKRQYFMAVHISYSNDCSSQVAVCQVRSEQKREKLINFTNALLEKNHNLFAL